MPVPFPKPGEEGVVHTPVRGRALVTGTPRRYRSDNRLGVNRFQGKS
ncbi:MAG: hypothetical protein IPL78_25935 [Chloroflexi bacterium]|nr:hypothetical protein [Chloroflexota bacterium]